MLEYKVLKEKHWCGRWIRIYENPANAFLVVEEDGDEILNASFHFFWKEALKVFNKIKHEGYANESKGK